MDRRSKVTSPTLTVVGLGKKRTSAESDIISALQEALDSADPIAILRHELELKAGVLRIDSHSFHISSFGRVLVIGAGKASGKMALEVERILNGRITDGVVNLPNYQKPRLHCQRISFCYASHPIPGAEGVKGVERMLGLVGAPAPNDLVICLLSGGCSALMPAPIEGVTLQDLQETTRLLLKSGADISEMNAVRKHLSRITGGRLAEKLYPATVLSLIISDVVGDRLDSIASGPTAPDETTYTDARAVLQRRKIWTRVPQSVRLAIAEGAEGKRKETPKRGSKVFKNVSNFIVGNNRHPCESATQSLARMGYRARLLSTSIHGEARDIGRSLPRALLDMTGGEFPPSHPVALVAGGETTVTVRGGGKGGRNQELALSAAISIAGMRGVHIASMETDGLDGPTDAAGALVDGDTVFRARRMGLDPEDFLLSNDSYTFFKKLGGLLYTGPTGTNVNDILVAIARP